MSGLRRTVMLIQYTAYDRTGRKIVDTMEADSEQTAQEILWESELIVTQVRRVRAGRKLPALHTIFPTVFGAKQADVVTLMRQLATLLDSGLPVLLSLQAMRHEAVHPMIRDALTGLTDFIGEGGRFSDGISRYPAIFPAIFVRLARIGEQTGELSSVLRRGAEYLESQAEVKRKLRSSLMYPCIVASTAAVSVYILINFSIPMLSGLLEEFDAELPIFTRILLATSGFANAYGLWILLISVIAVALYWMYRRTADGKLVTDRVILRLPMVGSMVQKNSIARSAQTLASLLQSGIPLLEAVELTAENTDNAVMKQALERTRLELLAGSSMSDAMSRNSIFPPLLIEMSRVGEAVGNLADQLDVISKVFQQEFDASIARMVGLIEPALILMVGGVVAMIGVTVITTVYSIIPSVSTS